MRCVNLQGTDLSFHKTKKALTSLTVFNISKIIERIMITGYIRKVSIKS